MLNESKNKSIHGVGKAKKITCENKGTNWMLKRGSDWRKWNN